MPTPPLTPLPDALQEDVERAGYYPALVKDVVSAALAGDEVLSHLVHQETTIDQEQIRRHVTVLVLTRDRLVVAHADDHAQEPGLLGVEGQYATASSESIPVRAVRAVMLTHVVVDPHRYVPGSLGRELTLTIGWGTVQRIDLLPGQCADPTCEADHGFEGTVSADDLALRVSADAEGEQSLTRAREFADALSRAIGQA